MDTVHYLEKFNAAANKLHAKNNLDVRVGVWLESVALKMDKPAWRNGDEQSIFFSVWLNDETLKEQKLYYNIHAFKLRQLRGYNIKSREFAADFRAAFAPFKNNWPNVSIDYGPLTLMEGWVELSEDNLENDITVLTNRFLDIVFIIDELLAERWKA